jgi:hypothetical protein
MLRAAVALDATPEGARANLASNLPSPHGIVSDEPPPLRLGEDTVATTSTRTAPDGTTVEVRTLRWVHGRVLLAVTMSGPVGSTDWDTVASLAQLLEQRYQQRPLASGG